MADYDSATGELAAQLVTLHGLADAVIPRIAEAYGESNQLVSQAGGSEDLDFTHENGEDDELKEKFSEARKALVDILKDNNERLYAHAAVLKDVIEAFNEDDEMNSKNLHKAYDDELDDQKKDNNRRIDEDDFAPYEPPDTTHTPIGSGDEITDPSQRPSGPGEMW